MGEVRLKANVKEEERSRQKEGDEGKKKESREKTNVDGNVFRSTNNPT